MKLSLHDEVRVHLNKRGHYLLERHKRKAMKLMPADMAAEYDRYDIHEDSEGYSVWTIGELMQTFGRHIKPGHPFPFDVIRDR